MALKSDCWTEQSNRFVSEACTENHL